jgi:hypothetical protein
MRESLRTIVAVGMCVGWVYSAPPAHVRLRLRGGDSQAAGLAAELLYPGPFRSVPEAVAVAKALRKPLMIARGVHRW